MTKTAELLILFLVVCLGLLFRVYQLDNNPPSPNWDEVSLGYNAYSILHTGRDEWGNRLPTIFPAYGDYKLPVYIYSLLPFIILFGLSTFSIRLLSVVAGSISIYIFYKICNLLFKQAPIKLIGTTIFALSPWSIFLSRIALEANLGLTFFLISFYFLLKNKYWQSTLFFGIYLFTYNSSRIFLPFYIAIIIYQILKTPLYLRQNTWKFMPFLLFICLFVFQSLTQNATDRYKWVSLLDSGAINKINELQSKHGRIIANKATYLVYQVSQNYISHFNPQYIFFQGGSQHQFNLPNYNLISPWFYPFFLLGILMLLKTKSIIFLFLLLSPLPSAITRDAPHILRSLPLLPLTIITITYGISYFYTKFSIRFMVLVTSFIIISNLVWFWSKYATYQQNYSLAWQYGYKEAIDFIIKHHDDYPQVIMTKKYGEPHEFLLFFQQYPPKKYQTDSSKKWSYHTDWFWVDSFDKYQFINDWEVIPRTTSLSKPSLLITSPNNYNQTNSRLLKTINLPNGQAVFDIVSLNEY